MGNVGWMGRSCNLYRDGKLFAEDISAYCVKTYFRIEVTAKHKKTEVHRGGHSYSVEAADYEAPMGNSKFIQKYGINNFIAWQMMNRRYGRG